jgi:hypothetical protein
MGRKVEEGGSAYIEREAATRLCNMDIPYLFRRMLLKMDRLGRERTGKKKKKLTWSA